jgi:hypothetical protein
MFSVKIVHFYSYADDSSCLSGILLYLLHPEAWVVETTKNCSDIMLHDSSLKELWTMENGRTRYSQEVVQYPSDHLGSLCMYHYFKEHHAFS